METVPDTSVRKRLRDRVRYFNREYFNPFALSFAGRPKSFWSVILHTGRKTGQAYTTPIVAVRQKDSFVVPLPYGRHVDWFRNVMAAGGCDLIYQGRVYHATEPEIIPVETGIGAFSGFVQSRLRRSDTEAYLRFNRVEAALDGKALYQSFVNFYPLSRGLWVLVALATFTIGIGLLTARCRCKCSREGEAL